jgi:hypothetical protein
MAHRYALIPLACTTLLGLSSAVMPAVEDDRDRIVLHNGHEVVGRLEGDPDSASPLVVVATEHGSMSMARERVAHFVLGYESRRRLLEENDYQAVLALATWCLDRDLKVEALDLATKASELPDHDGRSILLLARLTDAAGKHREALELYRRYKELFGGDDPDALERLAYLDQHYRAYEEALQKYQDQLAGRQAAHVDGLESRPGWRQENPAYANEAKIGIEELQHGGITNKVLRVDFTAGDKHKAAVRRKVSIDASGSPRLSLQVHNPGKRPVGISVAVKSGERYVYFESPTTTIPPTTDRPHEVVFDLSATNFKSEASGWNHSAPIANAEDIRELQIQIHNRRRSGHLFLDGIGVGGR